MKLLLRRLIPIFVVWLIVGIVFGRGLGNGFVLDDKAQIAENQLVKSGDWWKYFLGQSTFDDGGAVTIRHIYYKPLLGLWWMVNYRLWGGVNIFGFHLTQLGLHLVNVGLVYELVFVIEERLKKGNKIRDTRHKQTKNSKLQNSKGAEGVIDLRSQKWSWVFGLAFWVALIWGVHSANVESVVYASAAQELLVVFFGLLGLIVLVKWSRFNGWLLGLCFFAAGLAKETGLVMVLVGWWWTKSRGKISFERKMRQLVAVVWGGYLLLRLGVAKVGFFQKVEAIPIQRASYIERTMTIPYVLFGHVRGMFWPVESYISDHVVIDNLSWEWVGWCMVLGIFGWWLWQEFVSDGVLGKWLVGWWMFAVILVTNVVALDVTFAERWLYVPLIPVTWLVVRRVMKIKLGWVLLVTIVGAMGLRSMLRIQDWKDDYSLAIADVDKGQKAYDLVNNLGWELYRRGDREEGKYWLERSIEMNPEWWVAYNNLGVYYHNLGDGDMAEKMYKASIEKGNFVLAWVNLTKLYRADGGERWKNVLDRALVDYPDNEVLVEMKNGR